MLGFENIMVLAVVLGAMILFVTNKLRVDLVALCVLAVLLVSGIIKPEQALYGFANPATATVAAMFVLSAGLARTGFVEWLARSIDRIAGKSPQQLVFVLCVTIGLLSAFIVNTATVTIFIPVAIALAKSRHISPSRVLIPLSYASQFGGVCTLVGTSTNILVNSIAVSNGLPKYGLFEFAPLGLIMSVVGIIFLVLVSGWLLPKRKGEYQKLDKYRLVDYLIELRVMEKSPLISTTWRKSKSKNSPEIELIKLIRAEKETWQPRDAKIKKGDILLLHGNMEKLMLMKDEYKLHPTETKLNDKKLSSDDVRLIEALVPPDSFLIGRTLKTANFYRRFKCRVFAVQRRGKIIRDRIAEIRFAAGDTTLLQCDKEDLDGILNSNDLIVTNELTDLHMRKDRVFTAIGIMAGVVALAAFNVFPILVAAIIGAVGMVLSRCISLEEAYKAINWKVIFLLGGILPLGIALHESGTAQILANSLLQPLIKFGPVTVLALLYLITAVMTETMSNNASAILLAPIAFSIAEILGVSPRPFLIAITFAASTSFATPIGYQTNTMIFTPGGYRFSDYSKIGIPLNLLFWGLAVLLIPVFWQF
ncbi:MAG: SLC13 family permease [Candidatus Cloacimonetes bacterium]|nr:SLC13 family permease [Candidatus Cloacimonadota bacterium]